MTPSLKGQVALVTGASSGIGRHLAGMLAREGVKVACGARSINRLEQLAAEVGSDPVLSVELDVCRRDSVEAAVEKTEERLGPIDILINAAGIAAPASFLKMTEQEWASVMETNLAGTWRTSQIAAGRMVERKRGVILNFASVVALAPQGKQANYGAAKAGVTQLTRIMALELGKYGVRVNAIAPGYFHTGMNDAFIRSDAGETYVRKLFPGRIGRLGELDEPVKLLVSPSGSYINGVILPVDGGTLLSAL